MNKKRLLKRILIGLMIVVLIALTVGYVYLRHVSHRALPDYNQDVLLDGLKEPVTVIRDAYAVPHIYAKNEEDLYRVTGYVMAQDRLWEMDLLRRATMGRLAEIFGEDLVESDLLMRALRISEKSKLMLSKTDPGVIQLGNAFSDGVNQYIQQHKDKLPPEFTILGYEPEPWEINHSVNLVGYMAWDLTFAWPTEPLLYKISQKLPPQKFKEMLPDMDKHGYSVIQDFKLSSSLLNVPGFTDHSLLAGNQKLADMGLGVFHGSNNWVVSGEKSVTGKPIFANDMHLGVFVPGIWYQVHQVVENKDGKDTLNVTGLALPGQPFIIAGHNRHIAWGMTNVMVDDMDFYLETVDKEKPTQYKFNGQWRDLDVKKEIIKIKGGDKVEETLAFTHRGPVISKFRDIEDQAVSMRWIGNEYSNELRTVYLLNRAENWLDFRNAVKTFISVSQNIAYADVDGNIGLQTCAGVPVRKGNAILIRPGDTDEYDWNGIVPFEELPYSFNPESGHVSSANNRTAPDAYPYYISYWYAMPHRVGRIREMLEEKEKISIDDIKRMHGDFKSKHVEHYLGDILAELKTENEPGLSPLETEAFKLLSDWDGVLGKESTAATVFEYTFLEMVRKLAQDELGDEFYNEYIGFKILVENLLMNVWANRQSQWIDNVDTKEKETFSHWIRTSFRGAVKRLAEDMGENPAQWQWGKQHKLVLRHPLGRVKLLDTLFDFNRGPYEVGGSFHTVCPFNYSLRRPFFSNYGPSHRHIYSTADWDDSLSVIPTGASGIPASPFYCDQTALYIDNRYHNDYVGKDKVEQNASFKSTYKSKTRQ
jgi:penicillin amidase